MIYETGVGVNTLLRNQKVSQFIRSLYCQAQRVPHELISKMIFAQLELFIEYDVMFLLSVDIDLVGSCNFQDSVLCQSEDTLQINCQKNVTDMLVEKLCEEQVFYLTSELMDQVSVTQRINSHQVIHLNGLNYGVCCGYWKLEEKKSIQFLMVFSRSDLNPFNIEYVNFLRFVLPHLLEVRKLSLSNGFRKILLDKSAKSYDRGSHSLKLIEKLTKRKREICHRLTKGKSDKEIGRDLGISYNTVSNHLKEVYRILNVQSRSEAIACLTLLGI